MISPDWPRFLIRLGHDHKFTPADQKNLLSRIRSFVQPPEAQAMNVRVSSHAIEFDFFCPKGNDLTSFLDALGGIGPVLTCKQLNLPPGAVNANAIITEARQLFNEHRFWEVHEVLENLWKSLKGSEKE